MDKVKIIYVFDSLCTWCYGFSPVVESVYKKYRSSFEFEVVSGGLVLDERVGPVHKLAPLGFYNLLERISETTGVTFGKPFLKKYEEGRYIYDSFIPATALGIFKQVRPQQSLSFAHAMQRAVYQYGEDLTQDSFYYNLALDFEVDPHTFVAKMHMEEYQQYAKYDFALAKQLNATSFPRLFMQTSDTYFYLIAEGYTDFPTLDVRIQNILSEIQQ